MARRERDRQSMQAANVSVLVVTESQMHIHMGRIQCGQQR